MVEKWILLRNRWRHEAFVLVQPNPVVAMKQHVTNGKGDRFIYWDHCPLLAERGPWLRPASDPKPPRPRVVITKLSQPGGPSTAVKRWSLGSTLEARMLDDRHCIATLVC